MRGTVLYAPRDVRFEERAAPTITKPTDAVIRISATCVCGSECQARSRRSRFTSTARWTMG
jgi:threonine dehydrogenase-like Zn-dependent dehydrogenase